MRHPGMPLRGGRGGRCGTGHAEVPTGEGGAKVGCRGGDDWNVCVCVCDAQSFQNLKAFAIIHPLSTASR
jgi:hypothetical protein